MQDEQILLRNAARTRRTYKHVSGYVTRCSLAAVTRFQDKGLEKGGRIVSQIVK